jgi:hypothetical protein
MVVLRGVKSSRQAGVTHRAPGRKPAARSRARLAAVVSVACAAGVFGATNASAAPARPQVTAARNAATAVSRFRSGLPWPSGVFLPNGTPAQAAAFAAWRKRPLDDVEVQLGQSTWATITDPAWLYRRWKGKPYTMVFSVAMLPIDVPGVSIGACARGSYNAYWKKFGKVINSYGLGSSIIRLGWEFNGKWERWAASNPSAWKECWRQAVTSAWSTAPRLRWDWAVNRGLSSALANPAQAYPGNHYVTMIGIDSYEWWPAVNSSGGWTKQLDGSQGLNSWLAFAKAHGKKLSVPEWGNMRYGESSGGDDPAYVKDMRAFFAANARYIGLETVFQGPRASYESGSVMPKSAEAYKMGF